MSGPPPPSPAEPAGPDPDRLIESLLERCRFPDADTALVCGVSGGADSLALLVLAVAAGCRVTAVHVDHGLRPGSAAEAQVVAAAARRFGASFRSERVAVGAGPNLEARARGARCRVLGPEAATGHTADDQAETVMVNLLRGAGVSGLAGMRAGPRHPLLALRRAETEELCRRMGLDPLQDPTNADPRFVRNRVRHELLPLCADVAGRDVVPLLARQAGVLAAEADLLDAVADLIEPEDAAALASAPEAVGRRSIRNWLVDAGGHPPPLDAVQRVLEVARNQRLATELPGGRRVGRRQGRLTVSPGDRGAGAPGRGAPVPGRGAPVQSHP
ncbi:MAG TPA: tRNA lysidine(34) synthetase TilS [Acidimicrobiales bacterium]|nr:tRNA lysidine(34) synthetase TilS [Acidimicrobiales bacterium]